MSVELGMPTIRTETPGHVDVPEVFDFDFSELYENGIKKVGELNPYITLGCDLRCSYCYMGDFLQSAINTTEQMSRGFFNGLVGTLIKDGGGLDRMTFLGGEPTLHPDITAMVNDAADQGVGELRMTTNGISLHNLELDKLKPRAFTCVSVSIDGINAAQNDATRGKGTHRKILKTLQQYRDSGIPLSVNFTVSASNIDALPEVPDFFHNLGVNIVNLHRASLNGAAYEDPALIVGAEKWVSARNELFRLLDKNMARYPGMTFRIPYTFLTSEEMQSLGYRPIQEENYHSPGGHRLIVLPATPKGGGLCYMSSDLIGERNAQLGRVDPTGKFRWNEHPQNELAAFKASQEHVPNVSTIITGQDAATGGLIRVSHSFKKVYGKDGIAIDG